MLKDLATFIIGALEIELLQMDGSNVGLEIACLLQQTPANVSRSQQTINKQLTNNINKQQKTKCNVQTFVKVRPQGLVVSKPLVNAAESDEQSVSGAAATAATGNVQ